MSTYYFVGSGIASLAGAAYLIRDAGVAGHDIVILEESADYGGALDAHANAAADYYMSGSRMFEDKYACTFALLASIPSASDPTISVTEETKRASIAVPWYDHARLVDRNGEILDAHALGFDERDRIALVALLATPENELDDVRIDDCFQPHFFTTHFWFEWSTLFAFQTWHSAVEFRRYLYRFIHRFATIDTQHGVYRTRTNQYDSIARPLMRWLREHGVRTRFETTVVDLAFRSYAHRIAVASIECLSSDETSHIELGDGDRVFVTNGSMTADKAFGAMDAAPLMRRERTGSAWRLWERLASGRPEFGDPSVFDSHVDESAWISFTVTVRDPLFFTLMERLSGSRAGEGGLLTFPESNWLLTLSIFHQPFFAEQPHGIDVWWGYGLFFDRPGNYVRKTMAECTGAEILEEVLGHLHFANDAAAIAAASVVIPCAMPFITSQFLVRKAGDRPNVVPAGATNFAFIGQFAELPEDVVFTVEYSIRSAQLAVYTLLDVRRELTPIYHGAHDPRVVFDALRTLHR
jgi:oleate hydratase